MRQTIEKVVLDDDGYSVTMVTTYLLPSVKLITCEGDATLMINDIDVAIDYTPQLADIIANLSAYSAEQLLTALTQVDRIAS